MRRRLVIGGCVVLVPAVVLFGVWMAFDLPPLRLVIEHGLPSDSLASPRARVFDSVEFFEIRPGYIHLQRRVLDQKGDFLGGVCQPLGLPLGQPEVRSRTYVDEWLELPRGLWLSGRTLVASKQDSPIRSYSSLRGGHALPLCDWLESRHAGSFRAATRDEVRFALASGALDASAAFGEGVPMDWQTIDLRIQTGTEWAGREWLASETIRRLFQAQGGKLTVDLRDSASPPWASDETRQDEETTPALRALSVSRPNTIQLTKLLVWIPPEEE